MSDAPLNASAASPLPLARQRERAHVTLRHGARAAMGTTFEAYLYASDGSEAAALLEMVWEEVERIEALLSDYRPASELSRLNAHAASASTCTDPELFALLDRAASHSRDSDGAFDLAVGALVDAWGFFRGSGRFPTEAQRTEALARSGWTRVTMRADGREVALEPGVRLDPGAIGKGYALDCAAELLTAHGVAAALLGAGASTYRAIGAPPGDTGWRVRVPSPFALDEPLSTVRLRDDALSTTGSYEKFFAMDGRTYCHVLDPRTGAPVEGRLQVTTLTRSATDADALSTALFVLGPEAGAALLARSGGSALWVEGDEGDAWTHAVGWSEPVATLRLPSQVR